MSSAELDWAFLIWPRKGKSQSSRIRVEKQGDGKPAVVRKEGIDGERDVDLLVCLYLGIVKNKRILLDMLQCAEVLRAGDGSFSSREWVSKAVKRIGRDQSVVLTDEKKLDWRSIEKQAEESATKEIESANKNEKRATIVNMKGSHQRR